MHAKGSRGIRIDFSCTWYENKKNEREILKMHIMKFLIVAFFSKITPLIPAAVNVTKVVINSKASWENISRNLNIMFRKHQRFATLSSKSPRQTGKILATTSPVRLKSRSLIHGNQINIVVKIATRAYIIPFEIRYENLNICFRNVLT